MFSKSGCYFIISKIHPDRIYIGSSVNCVNRFKRHLYELSKGCHGNARLQNHFNKYGPEDLIFQQISVLDRNELIFHEQKLIDHFQPFFNICLSAQSRSGVKASQKTRKKMRNSWHERRRIAWYYRP